MSIKIPQMRIDFRRYVIGKYHKHIIVSPHVHKIIKLYAKQHHVSMVETVHELFRIAFMQIEDLEEKDVPDK